MTWKKKVMLVTELTEWFGHKIRFSSWSSRKFNEQQNKIAESYLCCTGADRFVAARQFFLLYKVV